MQSNLTANCQNHQVSKKRKVTPMGPISGNKRFCYGRISSNPPNLATKSDRELASWESAYTSFQFQWLHVWMTLQKFGKFWTFEQYSEYGVLTKLCWSINVMEEHDASTQLLFGADDSDLHVLSTMGAWLKIYFSLSQAEENKFFFGFWGYDNPSTI